MSRAKKPPVQLTCAQAKNYAVSLKAAIVQLGQSVRTHAGAMDREHQERLRQILESIERLYWQTTNLEREAHERLRQQLSKDKDS